ncbi:TRAP transporter substrate-binding protein [Anaerosolibacter sp.]|uniref:TRAP transporter substrate-binding protein n=1 Tax=Anaerosolibacter sp. TaxID=1872527 RepID=UPI0039F01E2B
MKKLSLVLLTVMLVVSLALSGCAGNKPSTEAPQQGQEATPEPIKMVAAHNQTSPDNPYQVGLLKFQEVAESQSNGNITVEVHAGTLGTNENELVEKLKLGAADVVVVSPGFMTQTGVKEVDLLALPYLFENYEHWEKVVDGAAGEQLATLINEKSNNDFKIVGYWTAGVRHYYGKKPLASMADLKGLTIRTQTSGVVADFWTKAGAIPTSVAWGELYQALQQKTVDSAENAYPYYVQQNHHKTENGKYTTETGHDYTTRLLLVNGKKFDAMTPEQQEVVLAAAEASVQAEREALYAQENEYKEKLIAEGGEVNEIDRQPFIDLAKPIQDEFAKSIGAEDLLKQMRETK